MYEVRGFVVLVPRDHPAGIIAQLEKLAGERFAISTHVDNGPMGVSVFGFGNHGGSLATNLREIVAFPDSLKTPMEGFIQYLDDERNENIVFEIGKALAGEMTLGSNNTSTMDIRRVASAVSEG